MNRNKAVFLDRDGVVNRDPGDYTRSWSEFEFNPGVMDALKRFQEAGFLLIIVTNQGGIAKGLYTVEDYEYLTSMMLQEFEKNGVKIEEVYFSPHHDDHGRSLTRKPGSLLIERALYKYDLDPTASVMIGDKERDILAAQKAGVPGILIEVNSPLERIMDSVLNGR